MFLINLMHEMRLFILSFIIWEEVEFVDSQIVLQLNSYA